MHGIKRLQLIVIEIIFSVLQHTCFALGTYRHSCEGLCPGYNMLCVNRMNDRCDCYQIDLYIEVEWYMAAKKYFNYIYMYLELNKLYCDLYICTYLQYSDV